MLTHPKEEDPFQSPHIWHQVCPLDSPVRWLHRGVCSSNPAHNTTISDHKNVKQTEVMMMQLLAFSEAYNNNKCKTALPGNTLHPDPCMLDIEFSVHLGQNPVE